MMCLKLVLSLFATLLLVSPTVSQHAILDTDIGDDFDDMMALTFLSAVNTAFKLEAVIVSSFNTTKRAMMVAYAFDCFFGQTMKPSQYPPIVMGISGPDTSAMYQFGYVPSNFTMDDYQKRGGRVIGLKDVVSLIQGWNVDTDGYLRYIEIAPVSSLASIIQTIDTKSLSNMRVFTMNGAVYKGYNGKAPPVVEYNVNVNIAASKLMYANAENFYTKDGGAGIVSAPLDTTVFQQFQGDNWANFITFNRTDRPLVYTLLNAYQHWYDAGGKNNGALKPFSPATGTSTMYDVQAAFSAFTATTNKQLTCDTVSNNQILKYECLSVYVNATGYIVVDNNHGQQIAAAVDFTNGDPNKSTDMIGGLVLFIIAPRTAEQLKSE